jgi:hypothetical protein
LFLSIFFSFKEEKNLGFISFIEFLGYSKIVDSNVIVGGFPICKEALALPQYLESAHGTFGSSLETVVKSTDE